ncbi:carnitine acetyl transferase [Fomitiporia mediterranea MF3/22]|uniref:carnitine acetyl transferase n=1 Tax=Fomitiporia mediterranea (strain MF3/22) TaxID=694068 RepID=UPI0004407FB9|nr:carnitine acetyl transferase [Fomitiporia mediterranea MF3/22]EJD07249.1 carnitine acetyl transferase [Fomitiporia mediterranea MF3/22]
MSKPPAHWKRSAPGPPSGSLTVAGQHALPKLPVPTLADTLARLRRSLQPFAHSQDELHAAEKNITEFENGIAPVLQERLEKRQQETEHWLEEWWDTGAYMGYRDSVVVNVSYFYGFDDHPPMYPRGSVHRAAALTRAVLLFRKSYKLGLLPPEATKEGPICMDTYRWMFDCCRVPGSGGVDWADSYAKEGDLGDSGHIIVLRKNRFWRVDVSQSGSLLSTSDLERQLQHVYDNTNKLYPEVGVLTASNRDVWAKDYEELISDPTNASIMRDIHSSAFVLCLDDLRPDNLEAFSRQLWHGGRSGRWLANRWVDKPVQLIVCDGEDAHAGIMGEHSIMDGTPTARMCDDILNALASSSFDNGSPSSSFTLPKPLDWNISGTTRAAIERAIGAAQKLTDDQELRVYKTSYGKRAIKTFGVSPDSWSQLVVQLAYARLLARMGWKRNGGTYEAASTRKFAKGRTEAVRVVTAESDAWVRAMDSQEPDISDSTRRALFRSAASRHVQNVREAGAAQGIDRHLLGLQTLLRSSEPKPALFTDPLYLRAKNWVLSTSAVYSKHFMAYGWGEVVPDGFGVAYMTGSDDELFFNITSRVEMPLDVFMEEIERATRDVHVLFAKEKNPDAKL